MALSAGLILAFINRSLPLLFFIALLLTFAKFASEDFWPVLGWIGRTARDWWWALLVLVAVLWALVVLGVLAARGRLPGWVKRRRWAVDVLNRLTNRAVLEARMHENAEAVYIDAPALAEALKAKVIGQDAICDDLAAQIRRRLALRQRGKPVGVFLLAGYPGTGKTYLGKCLAEELHRPLLHLDMTQVSRGMSATMLFGSPKGYIGSTSYGKLTAGLRDMPDAVVLLDEIEKADPEVHKKFLTAWNDGFITEASDGRQVSTTRAIFMLTTNAASDTLEDLRRQFVQDPDEMRQAASQTLKDAGFAPEVLNRIDRIFVFARLAGLDIARVTALEIERMIEGYGLSVSDQGIDPERSCCSD